MTHEGVAQGCLDQAAWAVKLGSPMYEAILRRMADDVRAGEAPLAWLSMEPGPDQAELIATSGFHGRDVKVHSFAQVPGG